MWIPSQMSEAVFIEMLKENEVHFFDISNVCYNGLVEEDCL